MWFVDPDLLRRGQGLRRLADEAFGMSAVGGIENGAPLLNGFRRQTMMHDSAFDSLKTILDNPHQEAIDSVFLVRLRRVNAAEAPIKVSAII